MGFAWGLSGFRVLGFGRGHALYSPILVVFSAFFAGHRFLIQSFVAVL